jgi:hypothetical protein
MAKHKKKSPDDGTSATASMPQTMPSSEKQSLKSSKSKDALPSALSQPSTSALIICRNKYVSPALRCPTMRV